MPALSLSSAQCCSSAKISLPSSAKRGNFNAPLKVAARKPAFAGPRSRGLTVQVNAVSERVHLMMTKNPSTLMPFDDVEDAANMFIAGRFGHAPVVDEYGRLVGILSETDLLLGPEDYEQTVEDVMTTKVISVTSDCGYYAAADKMLKEKIHCLPVVDSNSSMKVIGILTRSDLLQWSWRDVLKRRSQNLSQKLGDLIGVEIYTSIRRRQGSE